MASKREPEVRISRQVHRLKGKRKGALLKEEVHSQHGKVVGYALASMNLNLCSADNGRVLGYDNSHGYHHRHWMGSVEPILFTTYEALLEQFLDEVYELWRMEDEKN